jgi:peroxiredoxin
MKFNKAISRSLIILSVFSFFNTGCNATGIKIKGEFSNLENHKYVYLYNYFGPDFYKKDSALQTNGSFTFSYKNPLPRGFYRIGVDNTLSTIIILGDESPIIKGDLKNLSGMEITNSKENEYYKNFVKYNENMNLEGNKIQAEAKTLMSQGTSDTVKFNASIKILQARLDSLNNGKKKFYNEFKEEHKSLFVSKLPDIFSNNESDTKDSFFSEAVLKDSELSRGDLLATRLTMFLQRFAPSSLQEAEAEGRTVLGKAWAPENKEVIYISLIKLFFQYDQDYSRSIADSYGKEFPKSKYAKKLLSELPKGAPAIGQPAPEISLADTTGKKIISLSSLKGKVVLIDFWASWCRPCRMENPNVVKAYEKYQDAGFTVFSVSLDDNKNNWAQAIRKDNLKWTSHVSDLKGWQSSAAKLYGVTGIPATFLIDRNGNIIGKNLRGEELESMLEKVCIKK